MRPAARIFSLWDIHEMIYLINGLTMDYRFFGERAPLASARKLADYLIDRRFRPLNKRGARLLIN